MEGVPKREFRHAREGVDVEGAALKQWTDQLLQKTGRGQEVMMRRRGAVAGKLKGSGEGGFSQNARGRVELAEIRVE